VSGAEAYVLYETQDNVAIVTLNRPERLNALSGGVMDALYELVHRAATDNSVRAVLLRGAGRGFCAGGDLKSGANTAEELARMSVEQRIQQLRRRTESAHLMHTMAKPTVTALRGAVMGAGVGLGLSADFRLASATVQFKTAFAELAFTGDFGTSYFLTRLAGVSAARDLLMLSKKIAAAEALALGLVSRVLEDEVLDAEALGFAQKLAQGPTDAFGSMKLALNSAADGATLAHTLDLEATAMVRASMTADHKEAAAAFIAKRAPSFTGH
jgi:2-(1,2-epoxy-1,2-dihydrophenyl)acetyl-CoA isomerase